MIIVTGGAGFIGKHLVKRLEAEGQECFVLDNHWRATTLPPRFDGLGSFDITDADDVYEAFIRAGGYDVKEVIHLAYINGTRHFYERPYEVMEVAMRGMLNILQHCKSFRVKKFTLVSSSEVCRFKTVDSDEAIPLVIPDPYNARYSYSAGKIMSEMMALHCGLFDKLTVVRPFNIYGPGMSPGHVIPDLIAQFEEYKDRDRVIIKILGSGSETRSFCYIDDFIDGLMIAREKGEHRGIYNVGVTHETSIAHLADIIGAVRGQLVTIQCGSQWREGDLPRRRPDISKLAALGYQPKWTLWNGLKATMERGNHVDAPDRTKAETEISASK